MRTDGISLGQFSICAVRIPGDGFPDTICQRSRASQMIEMVGQVSVFRVTLRGKTVAIVVFGLYSRFTVDAVRRFRQIGYGEEDLREFRRRVHDIGCLLFWRKDTDPVVLRIVRVRRVSGANESVPAVVGSYIHNPLR